MSPTTNSKGQSTIPATPPLSATSETQTKDITEKRGAIDPRQVPTLGRQWIDSFKKDIAEKRGGLVPQQVTTLGRQWINAFKQVWPIYLASHIAFLLLTYLATLFSTGNFSTRTFRISSLLEAWNRWDTKHFTFIADHGYDAVFRTAFFPLYPLLEHGLAYIVHNSFVVGLIISNVVTLLLFIVLYRLVTDDFDANTANRTVLYLAIFPSAFFLASAYNESLFIFLTLLSFYYMRHGQWWAAGLLGCLTSLTRSAGLLLVIPFCYEYLRQRNFQLRKIRGDSLSIVLIPTGVAAFAVYCYEQFHDILAFSHAQAGWGRALTFPGMTFIYAWKIIRYNPILGFFSIHTAIDLSTTLLMLFLVVCCFVGPWKFARTHRSYAVYTCVLYIFLIAFPAVQFPAQSLTRQMIELFPAFIILARLGKHARFQLYYLSIAGTLLCFLLLQFLTGYWTV